MKALNEFLNESKPALKISKGELKKRLKAFSKLRKKKTTKKAKPEFSLTKKKHLGFIKSIAKKMNIKLSESLVGDEALSVLVSVYGGEVDDYDEEDYLILTDDEANEMVKEYIEESLWAFNLDFIMNNLMSQEDINSYLGLESSYYDDDTEDYVEMDDADEVFYLNMGESLEDYISNLQSEADSDSIMSLLEDFDEFVEEAIRYDGRGHFLGSYDGAEEEEGEYYVYRIN